MTRAVSRSRYASSSRPCKPNVWMMSGVGSMDRRRLAADHAQRSHDICHTLHIAKIAEASAHTMPEPPPKSCDAQHLLNIAKLSLPPTSVKLCAWLNRRAPPANATLRCESHRFRLYDMRHTLSQGGNKYLDQAGVTPLSSPTIWTRRNWRRPCAKLDSRTSW